MIFKRIRDGALALWLLAATLALFLPFSPGMPYAGLDAAWVLALNEATARGMALGHDLIFTYGPYSAIYTRAYHPGTYALTVAAGLYLALSYTAALLLLMRGAAPRWNLAVLALLCGAMGYLRDPIIMSVPLVAALGVAQLSGPQLRWSWRWQVASTLLLFAPLGLLPLVKGSFGILCLATVLLSAAFLLLRKRPALAAACAMAPAASMMLFWAVSGQTLGNLPGYFSHMLPIISGYTEAMSVMGDNRQALAYVGVGLFLLWALVAGGVAGGVKDGTRWRETGLVRLYLLGAFGLFLFMSFKGIYARHDLWRGLAGGTTLLVAALLLRSALSIQTGKRRRFWPVMLVAVLGFAYIDRKGFTTPDLMGPKSLTESYSYVLREWRARRDEPDVLKRQFSEAMAALTAGTPLPTLPGTVDLYPTDQGALIASGNRWNPRPILQSYSAYTPQLAEWNRLHLRGASAPDHLYFKVDAIDERVPSLDDGPSWPTLLQRYTPTAMQGDYLVLDRRAVPMADAPAVELPMTEHPLGQWVDVPQNMGALMVRMEIRLTLYGRLAALLFKPSQLRIDVELLDGTQLNYRLVSTMARAGFLITPLVRDSGDFAMLYGDPALLAANRVRRLRVQPLLGLDRIWQHGFAISFDPLVRPDPIDLSALLKADRSFAAPAGTPLVAATRCEGSIDLFNRASPQRPPAVNHASRWLSAAGWLASSVGAGTVPEVSYLVFEASDGSRRFAPTQSSPRPDVAAYFKQPGLTTSGWNARVDTTGLQGRYSVGLGYRDGDSIKVCAEGRVLVDIGSATKQN